jgi:hypothetical protein
MDASGSGLHGASTSVEWVTGKYGHAAHFSGDDVVVVKESGNTILDVKTVLMVAWIKPSDRDVAADRGIVMNKENAYEFGLQKTTGRLQGAFGPGCWRWWGNDVVALDEWTHVAVGVDGTSERHFVSGVFTEQDGCAGLLATNDEDFKIGARSTCGADCHSSQFKGAIDEAMLFDRCLSNADMATVYGTPPSGAGVTNCYPIFTDCQSVSDCH